MAELDSDSPMRSGSVPISADHKMPSRGKYGLILAVVMSVTTITLLAVSFQQNRELANLRNAKENALRL